MHLRTLSRESSILLLYVDIFSSLNNQNSSPSYVFNNKQCYFQELKFSILLILFIFLYSLYFFFQIYDLTSGQKIVSLFDQNNLNNYVKNVACFSPCDNLVLNDGVLWDVRSNKMIHKFDKFNENMSGTFHPAGREIIISAEVVSFLNIWRILKYNSTKISLLMLLLLHCLLCFQVFNVNYNFKC